MVGSVPLFGNEIRSGSWTITPDTHNCYGYLITDMNKVTKLVNGTNLSSIIRRTEVIKLFKNLS
jgi:hypothetical protein